MSKSQPISFLPIFILSLLASGLFAQQVSDERFVVPFEGNPVAPIGRVGVYRVDQAALSWGGAGRIRVGKVEVYNSPKPDFDANAWKLVKAGSLNVEDLAGFSGHALGAVWDYSYPTLARAREVEPTIAEDERNPLAWMPSDQAVYELGRQAIPHLEDFRRVEALISDISWTALERAILMRVRGSRPQTLPPAPTSWQEIEQAIADGVYTPEIRAALMLGPGAAVTLQKMEQEFKEALAQRGEAPAPAHSAWMDWLNHTYQVMDNGLSATLTGYVKKAPSGREMQIGGLQPGMPRERSKPGRWPQADYDLVFSYHLMALRVMEVIRGTQKAYAFKANWLAEEIRMHAANMLATKLVALSISNTLSDNHFTGRTGQGGLLSTANLDDLLTLLLVADEIPTEIRRLFSEADVESTSETASPAMRASAEAKGRVAELLTAALKRFTQGDSAQVVEELIESVRANPHQLSVRVPKAQDDLNNIVVPEDDLVSTQHLAKLEELRSHATEMRAKYNWLIEVIRDQDRRALVDELSRLHDSNGDGELTPVEQARFSNQYFDVIDRGYLQKLIDQGYVMLSAGNRGGAYRFQGDQDNDGRRYDFQNSVDMRGLSIEIVPAEERDLLLELQSGATYRFSFKYLSDGLDRQQTYLRFLPLSSEAELLYNMEPSNNEVTDPFEQGKFIPFSFAKNRSDAEMQSGLYTGDTRDGDGNLTWKTVSFIMRDVPASVAGLSFEIKLDRVTGMGRFFYRDFHLEKLEDYFIEDFEPEVSRLTGKPIAEQPLSQTGVPPLWRRVLDTETGYTAHSEMRYNSVIVPGSASGDPQASGRSLEIRPQGSNVRLISRRWFPLRRDRSYHFTGKIRTENMGNKRAWYEVMLYDAERRPVTIDGLLTTPGRNVIRTPARGSNPQSIGWKELRTNSQFFIEEGLRLDDLRRKDLAQGYNTQVDSKRARFGIAYAQLAIVIEGPDPDYDARVFVDDIQLKEEPRVRLNLFRDFYDGEDGVPEERVFLGHPVAILNKEERGRRFSLGMELAIEGLAPNRAGFFYEMTLQDALGNVVSAASSLGSNAPDDTLFSTEDGELRVPDKDGRLRNPTIMLDELENLSNRMGFFQAHITVHYLGDPSKPSQPIVDRTFRIGFLPPSLLPEEQSGEFGVVMDDSTNVYRRVYDSLQQLRISEVAFPLYRETTSLDPADYAKQPFVEEYKLLAESMPDVRVVGILGPTPTALDKLYPERGAAAVYADSSRGEWPALLERTIIEWINHVERLTFGSPDDPSFGRFSSDASSAFDNLHASLNQAGLQWAPREIPITLALGGQQQDATAILLQSFQERWPTVLGALSQPNADALQALSPDESQKLQDARPRRVWMRDKEHFSFFVPATLNATQMEASVGEFLQYVSRLENALGNTPQETLANARQVLNGNADQVNFDAFVGDHNTPAQHTLVFEMKTVDGMDTDFIDQLRDMTEKVVAAKRMGFKRILVNRLRDYDDRPSGLLSRTNHAQPAFFAYRTLNSVLSHRDVVARQLRLSSGAEHVFFKDPDSGDLTLVMFPGDEDVTETVALGKGARRIDLMGNDYPLDAVTAPIPTASGETVLAPTGEVKIELLRGGLPVIITGIDTALMDSLLALRLDNADFQATETPQQRTLTVTNTFDEPTTFSVNVPFQIAAGNDDNIAAHARFIDDRGRELLLGAGKMGFESIELQPGATVDFTFSLVPRSTMSTGERIFPVRMTILGRENYSVLHRMPVSVQPTVYVNRADIAAPPELEVYQVILDVLSNAPQANTMVANVVIVGEENLRPFSKTFVVPANGGAQAILSMPRYPGKRLLGKKLRISLRQSPGAYFDNQTYEIVEDEERGGLKLEKLGIDAGNP